jgi:hypothetical protein
MSAHQIVMPDMVNPGQKQKPSPVIFKLKKELAANSAIHDRKKLSSSVSSPRHIDNSHAISTYRSCRQTRIEWFPTNAPKTINIYYVPLLLSTNNRAIVLEHYTSRKKTKSGVFLIVVSEKFLKSGRGL